MTGATITAVLADIMAPNSSGLSADIVLISLIGKYLLKQIGRKSAFLCNIVQTRHNIQYSQWNLTKSQGT